MGRKALLGMGVMLVLASASYAAPWLSRGDYGDVGIAIADTASPSERYGAERFKEYWKRCTGHEASIGNTPTRRVTVWIGSESLPADLRRAVRVEGLDPDGLHIRTKGPNLIIVGGRQRGCMYGVFEFFERYMGVRWLAPDCTHVPSAPESLPQIDYRYVPAFAWRDINYRAFSSHEFAAAHRLNGQFAALPPEMGGHIAFANGFAHTLHSFISPDEYGKDHPEYFSEVQGRRRTERASTQLCLTNPDVLRIVTDKTRDILRKSGPERRIVCITQMDTGFWCECPRCAAIDKEEGSQSGSVLWFVNQVADAIAGEFPDAYIDTFAYTYTRKPPKHIRPRDNVIVRLCSIECDFSRPHDDRHSVFNRAFHSDIDAWSKIAKHLYIWDYTQNWYCHQQPHPNFQVLQPNIRFFAKHRVEGLFEQSSPSSPHSDFEYLKAYLLGRAMWHPDFDWRTGMDEFISIYYQAAAPYVRQYIDLVTRKVLDQNFYLAFNAKLDWMDHDTVIKAEELFRQAFASTQDPVITERLKSIYLSVQYAALVCPPKVRYTGDAWELSRPPSLTFDEYWALMMKMGVTMLGDDPIQKLRERMQALTPPRNQRLAIEKLTNDRYEVWVVPQLNGAVVRFLDKATGTDLFRGEDVLLKERWCWQDWEVMDPEHPRLEEGITGAYDVVERAGDAIALQRKLANGLVVKRRFALGTGSAPLELEFKVTNQGDTPKPPLVKPHPEFWLQGSYTPELWVEKAGRWSESPLQAIGASGCGIRSNEPEGVSRWAAWIPKKRLAIVCTVPDKGLKDLFCFYNIANEHVNLEMVPSLGPLKPGESRTLRTEVSIEHRPPSALEPAR